MPVALVDLLAAHQLKVGILLALLKKERTGAGSYVSASLLESAIASLANQATNWLMAGHVPHRLGAMHPNIAPYGDIFYSADDKPIVIAAGTERQFRSLCQCIEQPEVATASAFATNADRVRGRKALRDRLEPAFSRFTRSELMQRFLEKDVPAGSIRSMPEVFELPQAQAMILEEELPDGKISRRVKTVVFRLQ